MRTLFAPDPELGLDSPAQQELARRFAWRFASKLALLECLVFVPTVLLPLSHFLSDWSWRHPIVLMYALGILVWPLVGFVDARRQLAEKREQGVLLTEEMISSAPVREFDSPLDPISTFDLCADRLSSIGMATALGYARPPAFRYQPFGGRITIARMRPFWFDGSVDVTIQQQDNRATRVRVRRRPGGWLLLSRLGQAIAIVDKVCAELEHALKNRRAAMDAAVRARELERTALQAKLHAMQAQVEPHFLYNTLANLKYLIRTDADRAQTMVDHLVGYFQAALPDMRSESSTVARELDLAEHYLNLMQIRMGERLRFSIDVDPAALDLPVPPAMLISLVENAIKHGLEPANRPGTIVVACRLARRGIELSVSDDGVGLGDEQAGDGVGLANIHQRLRLLYGNAALLRVEPRAGGGVAATLHLPRKLPRDIQKET